MLHKQWQVATSDLWPSCHMCGDKPCYLTISPHFPLICDWGVTGRRWTATRECGVCTLASTLSVLG